MPAEREPHVTPKNTLPHYAIEQPHTNGGLIRGNEPPPEHKRSIMGDMDTKREDSEHGC